MTEFIEPDFPKLEDYLINLKELSAKDFSNLTYNEIYKTYFDLALILPQIGAYLLAEKFNGRELYRVRMANSFKDFEDKSLVQTFSYPPTSACQQNGRANIKDKTVFYCSDGYFSGIKEANMNEGDEAYLGIWEMNAKRDLKYVTYLEEILPQTNYWKSMGEYHHNFLIIDQKNRNENLLKHRLAIRNFITDKFVNENLPYYLTSFIANENLYLGDADLLIYPSVKTQSNYVNYAFHPNVVNEHLKLKKIFHFKVTKYSASHTHLTIKSVGYIEDDRIKWRASNEQDRIEFGAEQIEK
jgi:hypothetical protein